MNEWHRKLGPDTARSAAGVFVWPLRSSCSIQNVCTGVTLHLVTPDVFWSRAVKSYSYTLHLAPCSTRLWSMDQCSSGFWDRNLLILVSEAVLHSDDKCPSPFSLLSAHKCQFSRALLKKLVVEHGRNKFSSPAEMPAVSFPSCCLSPYFYSRWTEDCKNREEPYSNNAVSRYKNLKTLFADYKTHLGGFCPIFSVEGVRIQLIIVRIKRQ